MRFADLQNIIDGEVIQQSTDQEITQLVTDSRSLSHFQESTLFLAFKGENHNGHSHILELYQKGIRQFIIEEAIDISNLPNANVIQVSSSVTALQAIARHHRRQFDYPVIGITGSNGKTIVKEWLYHLVSPYRNTVKSPKSYNSQIGVPLSIWQMNKHHELGIFEAGISTVGEMEKLQKIIQPSIGILTNIGSAHAEGFTNSAQKIVEKLQLFKACDQLIYCKDHKDIHELIITHNIPSISWSIVGTADITVQVEHQTHSQSLITVDYQNNKFSCPVPITDSASIQNITHCIAAMLVLGHTPDEILKGIENLPVVKMRLELKAGINNCQIIDDTYNNDLAGLEVALNFLSQQSSLDRTVVLSDILQSGMPDAQLYQKIAQLVSSNNVSQFIGIGSVISSYSTLFNDGSLFFQNTADLLSNLISLNLNKEAILVKGARPYQFEKIIAQLTQKIHGTVLEIDLNALTHNLNYYRQRLRSNTRLMVMVKAMAYGSGSKEIAHLLAHHKVDYLGVAYVDEGVALRKSGITTPIMVMNTSPDGFDNIITYDLAPEMYSLDILKQFVRFLNGRPALIHLKIDTGMRRLGFQEVNINALIEQLKAHPNVKIESIFSHLAGSDEARHNDFSKQQVIRLNTTYEQICTALSIKPIKHILNSSGILRFPEYHFDMVRLGIGLYGIDSNQQYQNQLLPISSLKTTISQINVIKKGETIGYGRKGVAIKDMRIATLAIGYADGFSRAFSNGVGEVVLDGHLLPVIGNVCMDMTMINLNDVEATVGDEVIIFGDQMPITTLSEKLNTIPYEILTNVSERVKRVFFQD